MRRTVILIMGVVLLTPACSVTPILTPLLSPAQPPSTTLPTLTPTHGPTNDAGVVDLRLVAARAAHTATALPNGAILIAGGCVVDGCGTASDQTFIISA